jgi:S1-C subfamily serine protease
VDMDLSSQKIAAQVGELNEDYPAKKAGLMVGDKILMIDDKEISNWPAMQDYIGESESKELVFTIERNGDLLTIPIVPKEYRQKDIFGKEHTTKIVGIKPLNIQSADFGTLL